MLQILNGVYLLSAGPLVTGCILTLVGDWRCLAMFLISGVSSFRALCAVGEELCSVFDATRSAVDIPAWRCFRCPQLSIFTGFFLRLVFLAGLIVKVLLRRCFINRLPVLDAVE